MKSSIHLILGGSRSGKSCRGEELAKKAGRPVVYIATCASEFLDDEMQARVVEHRRYRPDNWKTIENRFDLKNLLTENKDAFVLIDCLTLWIAFKQKSATDAVILAELEDALRRAHELELFLVVVSNEVGHGIVPVHPEARRFRDLAGSANQLVARYATTVELMIAGLPLVLKGGNAPATPV
jgi:adenosylcobinamide kinase/adenosylcobinamide-phosphate guanylyltransferase